MCRNPDACPGGSEPHSEGSTIFGVNCSDGYRGPLCGICEPGMIATARGECTKCGEWSGLFVIALLVVGAIALILVSTRVRGWFEIVLFVQTVVNMIEGMDIKAIIKICVAIAQILGPLPHILELNLPGSFKRLLSYFSFVMVNFTFSLPGIGCLTNGTHLSSLFVNLFIIAAIVTTIVVMNIYQTWSMHKVISADAVRQVFDEIDKDNDGVGKAELTAMILKVDSTIEQPEIDEIFDAVDKDHNHVIDVEEFLAGVTSLGDGKKGKKGIDSKFEQFVKKRAALDIKAHTIGEDSRLAFLLSHVLLSGSTAVYRTALRAHLSFVSATDEQGRDLVHVPRSWTWQFQIDR